MGSVKNINRFIEHANLSPTLAANDIDQLVDEAKTHSFLGVCVPPFWVKKASRENGNLDIQLITVIGFPLGYQMAETKEKEIEMAIKTGADELDVVMNISSFKTGLPWTKIELAKFSRQIHDAGKLMKVIIETSYLSDKEIITAGKLCADAGADFVKTSTGFAKEGAKASHIELLRKHLPSNVGIKASGGIKTLDQAITLINSGADRIGTSSGMEIMKELNAL